MRSILYFFAVITPLMLWSCNKADNVSDKPKGKAPGSTYPTVDEKKLAGVVRTRFDSPTPTERQLARRSRNNKLIKDMGLPVLEGLPVVEDDDAVKLRSPQEVATRCLATAFCALKGEAQDKQLLDSIIKDYAAANYFSPEEQRFIKALSPTKQELVDFCWRYKCVHVFLWAMKSRDSLAPPNVACRVPEDVKAIKAAGPAEFVPNAARCARRPRFWTWPTCTTGCTGPPSSCDSRA